MGKEKFPQEFVVTVTSKGQVTLPAEYRRQAKIEEGSKLAISVEEDGTARIVRKLTLDEIAGCLSRKYPGLSFTQEDIEAAITDRVTERWNRLSKPSKRSRRHAA